MRNHWFVQSAEVLFLVLGAYFDIRYRELPWMYFLIFTVAGTAGNILWKYQSPESIAAGCGIGFFLLLLAWVTKEEIGYGDGWGIVVLGLYEGGRGTFRMMLLALFLSGFYGIYIAVTSGRDGNRSIPYFPFLCLAYLGVGLL